MTSNLYEYIVPEAVSLNMNATSAEEVIRALGGKLMYAGYVRSTFVESALAREKITPTGLPLNGKYNAAIPHTDVQHVIKPGIGFATLLQPVAFHNMVSPDKIVNVQLVFILALDEAKTQIAVLQQLANVLQNTELVTNLMKANNFYQVRESLRKFLPNPSGENK